MRTPPSPRSTRRKTTISRCTRARNPAKDALAFILLGVGLAAVSYGLSRRSNEIKENSFTVGPDGHLQGPGRRAKPVAKFPLVTSTGSDYEVMFTAMMSGDMQLGGKSIQLSELASSGQAALGEIPGAFAMTVPPDARINMKLGESVF